LLALAGENEKAEALFLQALNDVEKKYARNQEVIADAIERVAAFYRKAGKVQQAEAIERKLQATSSSDKPDSND